MNIFESLLHSATQQDTPLHVGEVMGMWAYYTAVMEARSFCLLMLNHTPDPDLRELVEHFAADVEEPQGQELNRLMRREGIPLSETSPDKPKAEERAIPEGAKFTEPEIANLLVAKIEGLLNLANAGLAVSLRDDVAALFYRFHAHLLAQGYTLKKLMRKRGWLKVPPAYHTATVAAGH